MNVLFAYRKPRKCPKYGASPVSSILFGMPNMRRKLEQKLTEGRVTLGGYGIEMAELLLRCDICETDIYHERDRMVLEQYG